MRFISKTVGKILLVTFLVVLPVFSFAADIDGAPCDLQEEGKIWNPIKVCSLSEFIKTILEGVIKIGIPVIALAIIYSGFLFVAARGNSEKITKAKNALLYTLIGAAILLGSWAIAKLISETVLAL